MRLKPFQQGGLDGLCGVYAVINAVRLAAWPLRRISAKHSEALFALLAADLDRDGHLVKVLTRGTHAYLVSRMLNQADRWLANKLNLRLRFYRPFYNRPRAVSRSVVRVISDHMMAPQTTALIVLTGRYHHWSVVQAATPAFLILFDSDGIHRVRRRARAAARSDFCKTIGIVPRDLYLIWCERSQ
jgi:hypothetical protein